MTGADAGCHTTGEVDPRWQLLFGRELDDPKRHPDLRKHTTVKATPQHDEDRAVPNVGYLKQKRGSLGKRILRPTLKGFGTRGNRE